VFGGAEKGEEKDIKALNLFYGESCWETAKDENDLLKIYTERLKDSFLHLKKPCFISSIRVGDRHFYYDIILICKAGPYINAWKHLKNLLDWQNPKTIEIILDLLKGRLMEVDWFIDLSNKLKDIGKSKDVPLDYFM